MNHYEILQNLVMSTITMNFPDAQMEINSKTTNDGNFAEIAFSNLKVNTGSIDYHFAINMSYKKNKTNFECVLKVYSRSIKVFVPKAFGFIPCESTWSHFVAHEVTINNIEDTEDKIGELVAKTTEVATESKKILSETDFNIHADAYIVPENYEYVGSFRLIPNSIKTYLNFKEVNSILRATNLFTANKVMELAKRQGIDINKQNLSCMSCAHRISSGGVAKHTPTDTYIYFGNICSANRFSFKNNVEKDISDLNKKLAKLLYMAKKNGMYEPNKGE